MNYIVTGVRTADVMRCKLWCTRLLEAAGSCNFKPTCFVLSLWNINLWCNYLFVLLLVAHPTNGLPKPAIIWRTTSENVWDNARYPYSVQSMTTFYPFYNNAWVYFLLSLSTLLTTLIMIVTVEQKTTAMCSHLWFKLTSDNLVHINIRGPFGIMISSYEY